MATVLKSNSLATGINTTQAEVFNWEDVAGRAKDYLETIRTQARAMLDACTKECEQLRENKTICKRMLACNSVRVVIDS